MLVSCVWKNVGILKHLDANILLNTGQENNRAQPETDKWFSFSLYLVVVLSVVLQLHKGFP